MNSRGTPTVVMLVLAGGSFAACGAAANPPSTTAATVAASPVEPTVAATTPASPSSSRAPVPEGLQFRWVGPTRQIPGLVPPPITSFLEVTAATEEFNAADTGPRILTSTASLDPKGNLEFVLNEDGSGCHAGDLGTYSFTLSPSGRALSLTAIADACAARVAAIVGDWIRANCPNGLNPCLGDVDPGEHVSVVFTPFVPPSNWRYNYGRFAFTVPDGWDNLEDGKDDYVLATRGAAPDTDILLIAGVAAHVQDKACSELAPPEPGVGTSPQAIAKWIGTIPGLITTKPTPTKVGGIQGVTLDVSVSPTSTHHCPFIDAPGAQLFSPSDPKSEFDFGVWGTGRMRLFLLDLGHERTLMVDIAAQDKTTWGALVPDALPVVDSFHFSH
jgi:hypothetical protein